MKRIYVLLTLCIFFISKGAAQNWALPSSQWVETEFSPWGGYSWPHFLFVEKDTTISSIPCAKIIMDSTHDAITYTYLSGDTVYMFVNGRFEPTMYFGAHVGDTLQFYTDGNASYDSTPYVHGKVDSITMISMSGQNLRQFNISVIDTLRQGYFYSNIFPPHIVYAEKIGFIFTYPSLFYQIYSSVVDADSYSLCNYGDSTISGFWLYPNADCRARHVGISDISPDEIFSIYPNPTSEYLHVNTSLVDFQIKLCDISGRGIPIELNKAEIYIRNLSDGIYFISIISSGQQIETRRFIKQ